MHTHTHTRRAHALQRYGSDKIMNVHVDILWAEIARSVWHFTTVWMIRGSNPHMGEIFFNHPEQPWGTPSLLYNGYWVFLAVQQTGNGIDHPPPSTAVVKGKNRTMRLLPLWPLVSGYRVNFLCVF
jgi:hypothetical protein